MNNFLEFVIQDKEAKKKILSNMPLKTKTQKKKYNDKLESITNCYQGYKDAVYQYMLAKKEKNPILPVEKNIDVLEKKVEDLRRLVKMLEPTSTYFEKLEFDKLLYEMTSQSASSFDRINRIIEEIINKFELVGIKLTENDFDVTIYVKKYMKNYYEVINANKKDFSDLNSTFEKVYWNNPEIIEHIELNFRQLFNKYKKEFEQYINNNEKKLLNDYKIYDYADALKLYKNKYNELTEVKKESIYNIVQSAISNKIDIDEYLPESNKSNVAFNSLINKELKTKMDKTKFYTSMNKLRENLKEYKSYKEYSEIFKKFKEEFPLDNKMTDKRKTIEEKIKQKETELNKLNKKIYKKSIKKSNSEKHRMKIIDSICIARELHQLYLMHANETVKQLILPYVNSSMNISDAIEIISCFNCFRLNMIKDVYEITKYDELEKFDKKLMEFLDNPNNIIFSGIYNYGNNDIPSIIIKKYRFENIKLTENDLDENNIENLIGKISYILRIQKIENSDLDIEKLWFYIQMEKMKHL